MPTDNMEYYYEQEATVSGKDKKHFVDRFLGSLSILCPEDAWKEAVDYVVNSYKEVKT